MYDGKVWIALFVVISLLTIFIKDRKRFIQANIVLNTFFIGLILIITIFQISDISGIESDVEAVGFIPVAGRVMLDFLHWSSDRFIGVIIYFTINLIVTYRKLVFVKAEPEQNQEE